MDARQRFDTAYVAYQHGRLDEALTALISLNTNFPNNPSILHVLALVESGIGNLDSAKVHFVHAMRLAPQDGELAAGAASLLLKMKDIGAISMYDRAIILLPERNDFRLNRAIALLELGRAAIALEDIAFLAEAEANNARYWSIAAQIRRVCGDIDASKFAFEKALEIEPNRIIALVGLGELLLREGDNIAITYLKQAHNKVPDVDSITLSYAEALEADGRFDAAITLLDDATAKHLQWIDGLKALSRMRGEAGQLDRMWDGFERAVAAKPHDELLWSNYAAMLRSDDQQQSALSVLERGRAFIPAASMLALIEAGVADDIGDTDRATALLNALPLGGLDIATVRIRHAICCGDPEQGAAFVAPLLESHPDNIGLWALASLCWRMTGDTKEQWINPGEGLFRTIDIGLPGANGELADTLRAMHLAKEHPAGQSLRHGTQTRGSLFSRREPILTELAHIIRQAVACYMSDLPPHDKRHPLWKHRDDTLDFAGSWSVRLNGGGFHVSHIHPAGILSSAFYVALPDNLGGVAKEGWLEVGGAPPELKTGLEPYALIEPRAGRLALFPSYLFHGTRPFVKGERLSVAFDIASST